MDDIVNELRSQSIIPYPHSFPDYKYLSIAVTDRTISGEIAQYTLCVVFPFDLPVGLIVLEGFVGSLFRFELGSA